MRDNVRLEVKTNPLDPPVFWDDFVYHYKPKVPIIKHTVNYMVFVPTIKKIIRNGPCTIVIWNDGTKTIVRQAEFDWEDNYAAVAQAIAKKIYGSTNAFHKFVDNHYEIHISKKELKKENLREEKQMYGYSLKEVADSIQGMANMAQKALEKISEF